MIVNLKADPRRTPGDYTVYFLLDSLSSTRYKPVDGVQDADTKGGHDRRYAMRMIFRSRRRFAGFSAIPSAVPCTGPDAKAIPR